MKLRRRRIPYGTKATAAVARAVRYASKRRRVQEIRMDGHDLPVTSNDPALLSERAEEKQILAALLTRLPHTRALVIELRLTEMTLSDIGKALGITRERVRQIEFNAIRQLQRAYMTQKSPRQRQKEALWR